MTAVCGQLSTVLLFGKSSKIGAWRSGSHWYVQVRNSGPAETVRRGSRHSDVLNAGREAVCLLAGRQEKGRRQGR